MVFTETDTENSPGDSPLNLPGARPGVHFGIYFLSDSSRELQEFLQGISSRMLLSMHFSISLRILSTNYQDYLQVVPDISII